MNDRQIEALYRRTKLMAFLAWVSARQSRQERFKCLLLLFRFGRFGFSTKHSTIMLVPPGAPYWEINTADYAGMTHPVFNWQESPSVEVSTTRLIPECWSFCRGELEVRMRATFTPEIGEHGMAIVDGASPTVIICRADEWWRTG